MRPIAPALLTTAPLALVAAALALLAFLPPAAAQEHRHGTGSLVMTFQGPVLTFDLAVPAADIVGFEHAPAVDEDFTDIAQARAAFTDPSQVVALPLQAGCATDRAEAEFVPLARAAGDQPHASFTVLYEMTCETPARLSSVSFPLFGLYPSLTALQVRLVVGNAHRDVTVTRDRPQLDLTR
ncbi:DUF2796 domain-containing protein [Marinibaculum pumilum]|uniref:DUF2796 domain-containing protein n=1 Tax=Marinibaculum pumilum TaxID=1766165 RepID=A0ABV7L8P0_9PROT